MWVSHLFLIENSFGGEPDSLRCMTTDLLAPVARSYCARKRFNIAGSGSKPRPARDGGAILPLCGSGMLGSSQASVFTYMNSNSDGSGNTLARCNVAQ